MKRLIGSLVIMFCAFSAIPALAAAADDAAKACAGGDPNPDKRIAACGKVLATNPKQDAKIAWVFKARGNAYFSKGDLDKAVKDYDIAIRLDPRDSTALANRGTMHMSQGEGALALADYNGALQGQSQGQPTSIVSAASSIPGPAISTWRSRTTPALSSSIRNSPTPIAVAAMLITSPKNTTWPWPISTPP